MNRPPDHIRVGDIGPPLDEARQNPIAGGAGAATGVFAVTAASLEQGRAVGIVTRRTDPVARPQTPPPPVRPLNQPVFLDRHGRRHRRLRATSVAAAAGIVALLVVLAAAVAVPWPGTPPRWDAAAVARGTGTP